MLRIGLAVWIKINDDEIYGARKSVFSFWWHPTLNFNLENKKLTVAYKATSLGLAV